MPITMMFILLDKFYVDIFIIILHRNNQGLMTCQYSTYSGANTQTPGIKEFKSKNHIVNQTEVLVLVIVTGSFINQHRINNQLAYI